LRNQKKGKKKEKGNVFPFPFNPDKPNEGEQQQRRRMNSDIFQKEKRGREGGGKEIFRGTLK